MKIASTGRPGHQTELTSKPIPPEVQWVWADSIAGLAAVQDADLYLDLEFDMDSQRAADLALLPAPVIVHSVTHTLPEIAALLPIAFPGPRQPGSGTMSQFARINAWPGFLQRSVWELAAADRSTGERLCGQLGEAGLSCRLVADIPGLVGARILSSVINEAYYTLEDKVSTREEIDTAMRLGTNYPWGPFEWGSRIGLPYIYALLDKLERSDGRYAPSRALLEDLGG